MGTSSSKFLQIINEKKMTEERCEIDPRSPSLHISRTPINNVLAQTSNRITKAQDLTTNIETPLSGSYESVSTRTKQLELLALDPRSPSHGIQRTPLTVCGSDEEEVKEKSPEDSACESFESALSKIDFNSSSDEEEEEKEKKFLETDFDYKPPESCLKVENTIDPRSPGLERTPFVFEDEDPVKDCCDNATPKSVFEDRGRNVAPKVFQDENLQQCPTPKQLSVVQEGNRTPLGCLANRGIPRSALKTPVDAKGIFRSVGDTENCSTKSATSARGLITRSAQSKIPLPTRRCVEN